MTQQDGTLTAVCAHTNTRPPTAQGEKLKKTVFTQEEIIFMHWPLWLVGSSTVHHYFGIHKPDPLVDLVCVCVSLVL